MSKPTLASIGLRISYHGVPPIHWTGGTGDFGLQDKEGVLFRGHVDPKGRVLFNLSVDVRTGADGAPVFLGPFTHGSPSGRFLYLSWRNANGAFAMRFKLPLGSITSHQVEHALKTGEPVLGELILPVQRATQTGANVGGTRAVFWS